jgi:hypothetical protein
LASSAELSRLLINLKEISSFLLPIVLTFIGYIINRSLKRLESRMAVSRDLMERRFKDFDELTSSLNDLFCYCTYVGHWREITPPEALEAKRKLDKLVYQTLPIWGSNFLIAYRGFIRVCFLEYDGRGTSARIRADINLHKENWGQSWKGEWDQYFVSPSSRFDWPLKQQAYTSLLWEERKPFCRLLFSIAPSLFAHDVQRTELSFRRHLVQPAYARLIEAIGANLGVSLDPQALLTTWDNRKEV